jgi:hypothetical protein
MNQLAIIDDLAARRSAAANKAWETRRLRGTAPTLTYRSTPSARADALATFEREAAADMPDWHRAALALKHALGAGQSRALAAGAPRPGRIKPLALPAPRWHDYPVDRVGSFSIRTDILVVTFACGEIVRAPAVSAKGKPTNIGRGLRIAIAFYQARACWRRGIKFRLGVHAAVPAIASCSCEDTGEIFDAEQCTLRTIETRKAQDWRIRNDRRRIEASPPRSE